MIRWLPFWFACAVLGVTLGWLSLHPEVVVFLAVVAAISSVARRGEVTS